MSSCRQGASQEDCGAGPEAARGWVGLGQPGPGPAPLPRALPSTPSEKSSEQNSKHDLLTVHLMKGPTTPQNSEHHLSI